MNDTVITLQWNEPNKEPLKEREVALLLPNDPSDGEANIEFGFFWNFETKRFEEYSHEDLLIWRPNQIIAWAYTSLDNPVDLQTGQLIG